MKLHQMQLFKGSGPAAYDVNSVNGTRNLVPDTRPRLSAGAALQLRIVDDRVFSVGITTWRNLIDLALDTGHIELFSSDGDRMGLRKPGFLYAALPRLPERGAEYIKNRMLAKGAAAYLSKRTNPRKTSASLSDGRHFVVTIKSDALSVHLPADQGIPLTWELNYYLFPFTDGDTGADLSKARGTVTARLRSFMKECGTQGMLNRNDLTKVSEVLHEMAVKIRSQPL